MSLNTFAKIRYIGFRTNRNQKYKMQIQKQHFSFGLFGSMGVTYFLNMHGLFFKNMQNYTVKCTDFNAENECDDLCDVLHNFY